MLLGWYIYHPWSKYSKNEYVRGKTCSMYDGENIWKQKNYQFFWKITENKNRQGRHAWFTWF